MSDESRVRITPTQKEPAANEALSGSLREGKRLIRYGMLAIFISFGVLGGWAAFAPLSGAVIVPAIIKVENYRKTLQHLEGGIVKEILVQNGSHVRQGQPLIVLQDVQQRAGMGVLRTQLDAQLAKAARLSTERDRLPRIEFPRELMARAGDADVAPILKRENDLFRARLKLIDGQAELLRNQIKQVEEEMVGLNQEIKAVDTHMDLLKEELALNETLHKQGFVQYTRLLPFKRAMAEREERRGEYMADLAQAKQKVTELKLRINMLSDNMVKEATDELKEVERSIKELLDKIQPIEDALKRQVIVAPIDGEVVDLRVHTLGGVVRPGEPLLDIVPGKTKLVSEGRLGIQDITHVKVGGEAEVQLTAFKQRTTPLVSGKVVYVSGDAIVGGDPSQPPYYVVHVEIDGASLKGLGGVSIQPGMPATLFIKTRERTALDYLLEPVTDTLRKSFKES